MPLTEREKSSPAYTEALGFMNAPSADKANKAIEKWKKNKLAIARSHLEHPKFQAYSNAVEQYGIELRNAYATYNAGNPAVREHVLKNLIYSTQGRQMRTTDVAIQRSAGNTVAPTATPPKKSGWWKWLALAVGVGIASWFGGKAAADKKTPEYKPPQTNTYVVNTPSKQRLGNGSKNGSISDGIGTWTKKQFNNLSDNPQQAAEDAKSAARTAKYAADAATYNRDAKWQEGQENVDLLRIVSDGSREGANIAKHVSDMGENINHAIHVWKGRHKVK